MGVLIIYVDWRLLITMMVEEDPRFSIPELGQSLSVMETRRSSRKLQVGAVNLPSLMNIDNVQYSTLKKLKDRNKDDDADEVAYGSPTVNNTQGTGIDYIIKIAY